MTTSSECYGRRPSVWQRVSSRHNRPPNIEMQRTSPVQHGGSPLISVLGGEHEARATIQVDCLEGTFHGQNNRYYRYHKWLWQGLRWTGIDKNESLQLESATRIHRIDENDSVPRRFCPEHRAQSWSVDAPKRNCIGWAIDAL